MNPALILHCHGVKEAVHQHRFATARRTMDVEPLCWDIELFTYTKNTKEFF